MAADDSVSKVLEGAKNTLANATKFTQSVEGNPTSAFEPKKPAAPHVPQAHAKPSYSMAASQRGNTVAEGLKAVRDNVQQYADSTK
jgi:hypothetical protein